MNNNNRRNLNSRSRGIPSPNIPIFLMNRMRPHAFAEIRGNDDYPDVDGLAWFYQTDQGVYMLVDVYGLPIKSGPCRPCFFGFHIHEGENCEVDDTDSFVNVEGHLNPSDCPHPAHLGDLPPLLTCNGHAWMAILIDTFRVEDIMGKVLIIHAKADNFNSQPAGDSGIKIGCGVISN